MRCLNVYLLNGNKIVCKFDGFSFIDLLSGRFTTNNTCDSICCLRPPARINHLPPPPKRYNNAKSHYCVVMQNLCSVKLHKIRIFVFLFYLFTRSYRESSLIKPQTEAIKLRNGKLKKIENQNTRSLK